MKILAKTKIFAFLISLVLLLAVGLSTAFAGGITVYLKLGMNGTNADGTCGSFVSDPDLKPGPGQQGWLFILTYPATTGPYLLSATFSDGTTIVNQNYSVNGGKLVNGT